jgi:hypothetical protein
MNNSGKNNNGGGNSSAEKSGKETGSLSPKGATATGKILCSTTISGKPLQKQTVPNNDLLRSFKATTSLAHGLTKERIHI